MKIEENVCAFMENFLWMQRAITVVLTMLLSSLPWRRANDVNDNDDDDGKNNNGNRSGQESKVQPKVRYMFVVRVEFYGQNWLNE